MVVSHTPLFFPSIDGLHRLWEQMAFNSMIYPGGFGYESHPGLPEFHMGSSQCLGESHKGSVHFRGRLGTILGQYPQWVLKPTQSWGNWTQPGWSS